LKEPDVFTRRGQALLAFLVRQKVTFISVAAVAATLIVAVYASDWWTERKSMRGWNAYLKAMKVEEGKRWEELKLVQQEFSNSRPGYFAAISLADHHFDLARKEGLKAGGNPANDAAEARAWYTKALQFSSLLSTEKQLVLINRGSTYEMANQLEEALTDYNSAASLAGEGKGIALLKVARVWQLKNDKPKATEVYESVASQFAPTEYGKIAKNYLREMKSPLFNTGRKK